jgi:Zn-dependent membrane protease YugP
MFLWNWYFDPLYLWIFFITLIISIATQAYLRSAYGRWSNVKNSASLNGIQVGQRIIQQTRLGVVSKAPSAPVETSELRKLADLRDKVIITADEFDAKKEQIQQKQSDVVVSRIKLARTPGQMTDHYDPRSHTVRASDGVATQPSVASMAIVAHELGHAQQHENNSALITMRNFLIPAVNFSSPLAYLCIFVGFLFNLAGLVGLGIFFYAIMVLFTLVTLPVEFDASRRGLKLLDKSGLMRTEADAKGSQQVLRAAALTYVAAAVTAVLQLLYYLRLAGRGRRR